MRTDRAPPGEGRGRRRPGPPPPRGGWGRHLRDLAGDPLGAGAGLVWVGFLAVVGRAIGPVVALLAPPPRDT